jgi:yeast amino acid transporter
VGIPIAAFAFTGIEIVAVAAVEARDPARSLRLPSQWIAYIISTIYLLSVGVFVLNVSWTDSDLPGLTDRKLSSYVSSSPNSTTTVMIIAVKEAGKEHVAAFLNGCLIVAILSTANTVLYGTLHPPLFSKYIGSFAGNSGSMFLLLIFFSAQWHPGHSLG